MIADERYKELNARCAEAIAFAEDTADELRAHCCERPKPQALLDPERLRQLRASRAATIAGLADADPNVRLAALSLFGPVRVRVALHGRTFPGRGLGCTVRTPPGRPGTR